jgi:hypothetical protein
MNAIGIGPVDERVIGPGRDELAARQRLVRQSRKD